VQRDPHFDPSLQLRFQLSEPTLEEPHERQHLERPRAALSFDCVSSPLSFWNHHLALAVKSSEGLEWSSFAPRRTRCR
jgi:hypothetical protein